MIHKYLSEEKGIWKIFGEDPNCDFGGSHHTPLLETVIGTYKNVVEYAQSLAGWTTWGGGGHIEKIPDNLVDVDGLFSTEAKQLKKEKDALINRLTEIDSELEQLKRG